MFPFYTAGGDWIRRYHCVALFETLKHVMLAVLASILLMSQKV
jgi:hypothetical protein